MAFLSISTMLASFMAALLCLRIPRQSLAQPYFYNPFGILKYIAFIGCDTSIIFCIERPIYQMRKAPGQSPGASFFVLYQRISPLHTRLTLPQALALRSRSSSTHLGRLMLMCTGVISISSASESVHGFVLKLLLRHGLYLLQCRRSGRSRTLRR